LSTDRGGATLRESRAFGSGIDWAPLDGAFALDAPRDCVDLLRDWARRAGASADAHYGLASRLSRSNIRLGVPVIALTTLVGTE
jgi:hypothetical protein